MKTLLIVFFALCLTASAQVGTYYAVTFYPTNSFEATNGMPPFEPKLVRALGTTNGPLNAGEVLFDWASVNNLISTNRTGLDAYQKAQAAPMQANINRLLELYAKIPVGRVMLTNDMASLTNIYASLASGTNTQAQVVARVNQANLISNDHMIILQAVLEFLQRLGPVLQQIYDPSRDMTQ